MLNERQAFPRMFDLNHVPAPTQPKHDDVRFLGKPIDTLTRDEAIAALRQALTEVKRLSGLPY